MKAKSRDNSEIHQCKLCIILSFKKWKTTGMWLIFVINQSHDGKLRGRVKELFQTNIESFYQFKIRKPNDSHGSHNTPFSKNNWKSNSEVPLLITSQVKLPECYFYHA